jgi:Mrp family chromosome partitioning ATPase
MIALIVVLAAGGTYALASLHRGASPPPRYVSKTEVYVEVADPAALVGTTAVPQPPDAQQISDLAFLFTGQAIMQAVSQRLGMPAAKAGSVVAAPLNSSSTFYSGTSIIVVTATSRSAKMAARLANAYVDSFLESRRRAEAAAATAQANALQLSLSNATSSAGAGQSVQVQILELRTQARNPSAGASQVAPAQVPTAAEPVAAQRSPAKDALLGAIVGLLLGVGIALGISLFDRRLLRVAAVEASYGHPVLAVMPRVTDAAPLHEGRAVIPLALVETLRALRVNLRLTSGKHPPRTVLVTSAMPGEGKSTLARNLALVHADGGDSVLLIDADLRRPSVPALFAIEGHSGLTHVLSGERWLSTAVVSVQGAHEPPRGTDGGLLSRWRAEQPAERNHHGSLDVLTHGELLDNPVTLLASRAMEELLAAARKRYDIVIIDSAPILAVTDTVPLLGLVDAVVLVARLGVTTRDAAERLTETLKRVPEAKVVGVVANDLRDTFLDSGYGGMYSSRYGGYGYRSSSDEPKLTVPAN